MIEHLLHLINSRIDISKCSGFEWNHCKALRFSFMSIRMRILLSSKLYVIRTNSSYLLEFSNTSSELVNSFSNFPSVEMVGRGVENGALFAALSTSPLLAARSLSRHNSSKRHYIISFTYFMRSRSLAKLFTTSFSIGLRLEFLS